MVARDSKSKLPPEAKRALVEAEMRRTTEKSSQKPAPKEVLGRSGPNPTRYGDWEKDGIISDF